MMTEDHSIRIQNHRIHNRLSYHRRPQKHLFVRRHLRLREECSALRQETIGPRLSRLLFRPSISLTSARRHPQHLTRGTLQVITVRLNPRTGPNCQNHRNQPSRNRVGTQLRTTCVHTPQKPRDFSVLSEFCFTYALSCHY